MTKRTLQARARAIAVLVAVTSLALASGPARAATALKTFSDWTLRCEPAADAGRAACVLAQSVTADGQDAVGLSVVVLKTPDKARILRVVAPLGVLLPAGVALKIDDAEIGSTAFVRCLANGCVAEVELSDDLVAKLSAGATATFTLMRTPAEGVALPVGLKGFKDGLAALP